VKARRPEEDILFGCWQLTGVARPPWLCRSWRRAGVLETLCCGDQLFTLALQPGLVGWCPGISNSLHIQLGGSNGVVKGLLAG